MSLKLIRRRAVEQKTGLGRSQIYADPTFPKPVPIGPRAVAWLESEIDAWIEIRIAMRDGIVNRRFGRAAAAEPTASTPSPEVA